jgi:hypothetical protein
MPAWINKNAEYHAIAATLGVAPGSDDFLGPLACDAAVTSNTAGLPDSGYRQTHMLQTDLRRRGALANALWRGTFYSSNSHFRRLSFENAYGISGRPVGYYPELTEDVKPVAPGFGLPHHGLSVPEYLPYGYAASFQAIGMTEWLVAPSSLGGANGLYEYAPTDISKKIIYVTGQDIAHWQPTKLLELAKKGAAWTITWKGVPNYPVADAAKEVLRHITYGEFGYLYKPNVATNFGPDYCADRDLSRWLDAGLQLYALGLLDAADWKMLLDFVVGYAKPWYEVAPGCMAVGKQTSFLPPAYYNPPDGSPSGTPEDPNGIFAYNNIQFAWAGAALDAVCMTGAFAEAVLGPVTNRILQWVVDSCDTTVANRCLPYVISLDATQFATLKATAPAAPPATIGDKLAAGTWERHFPGASPVDAWGYKAICHARRRGLSQSVAPFATAQQILDRIESVNVLAAPLPNGAYLHGTGTHINDKNAMWCVDENRAYAAFLGAAYTQYNPW